MTDNLATGLSGGFGGKVSGCFFKSSRRLSMCEIVKPDANFFKEALLSSPRDPDPSKTVLLDLRLFICDYP